MFATLLIPTLCHTLTDRSNDLTVQVGKTVEITASSINHCWFATVHRFSTGEILATMLMSGDDMNPEGAFSAYSISKDGGQTWSRRYTMGAGGTGDAYTQVSREDGTIWALGAGYDSLEANPSGQATYFHAALTRFSRGGMEFDQIRDARIHLSKPAISKPPTVMETGRKDATKLSVVYEANPWGAIVDGPGGEWLTTFYYTTERHPQQRLVLIRSTDQGRSWEEYGVIAASQPNEAHWPWTWMGKDGPNEAALVRLSKDRLFCLFRTGNGDYMGETWSVDDGKTWTAPVSSGFRGVAPHLRLMSDGLLACTYGRPGPVTIMFSSDEGKKWTNVTPIFDGMSSRYTDLIEVEPGKLLVVYDSTPYGGKSIPSFDTSSKNAIYGTFVEVRRRERRR
jgi:hypothetical protein